MPRTSWTDLPDAVRAEVADRVGPIRGAYDAETGAGSDLAVFVYGPDDPGVFVKGARVDNRETIEPLRREALVGRHAPPCAPRMLWQTDVDGWTLLAYELIPAAWADFAPGSLDLKSVAAALAEVSTVAAPDELPPAWERWGYWCDPAAEALFDGDRLVHADPAATNFLVLDGRAWLIDWAWAVRGPAWIDPMLWGGRLVIDRDHTPEAAAELVRALPGFASSTPRGRAALAHAEAASLAEVAETGHEEAAAQLPAARAWADFWKDAPPMP